MADKTPKSSSVNASILKAVYPKREPWTHKGDHGHLLIVAGCERFTGSAVFNALAALRAGVDLVTVMAPERAAAVAAQASPNIITVPLDGKRFEERHAPLVLTELENHSALLIGCGLWREEPTLSAILHVLKENKKPAVADADALRALARARQPVRNPQTILLPHANEFSALTGGLVAPTLADRVPKVAAAAKQYGSVVALKGHEDIIADGRPGKGNGRIAVNSTGTPLMAKGGFGDTLAGIAGAYLARGVDAFTAAQAACFVNGKAGELAAKRLGEGVLATDLFNEIPNVIPKK